MMFSSIKKIQNAAPGIYDFFNFISHSSLSQFSGKFFKPLTILIFLYALNFYTTHNSYATNYYIAVNGRSSGDGSKGNPWDLATGISGNYGSPGDTIFLRGGVYKGQFTSRLKGSSNRFLVLAQHPGETAIIDGNGGKAGVATFIISGSYTVYYGFQVMNSSSKRYTSQSGGSPTDIQHGTGIELTGPYNKLISLIVKDNLGAGVGFWKASTNSEMYGCLVYNNGWQGGDRGHGPGIYMQNETGTKLVRDNMMFGGFGRAIQIYGVNGGLNGFDINGNAIFNTSNLSKNGTAAIIIGGESKADNVTIRNNYIYKGFNSTGNGVQVHYGGTINGRLTIQNNKFLGGNPALSVKDWESISFSGNTVLGNTKIIDFSVRDIYLKNYNWNNNNYISTNTSNSMDGFTYDNWKKYFGFDGSSKFNTSRPSNEIVVKPHAYVKGSGTIVIVNYSGNSSVDVDLSRILSNGAEYEIRDVENFNSSPIITGKYSGGTVRIPMTLTATEKPNGVSSAPHSDSGFGVFVVSTKGKVSATAPVVVNTAPTLNGINDPQPINEDATVQTVNLSGISAGGSDQQVLKITATSDNTTLLQNPTVTYTSPNATGTLRYTPAANRWGTANITVKVDDGGSSNNVITRTFKVTVNPINDAPTLNAINNVSVAGNSSTQTINFSGITAGPFENQALTVTATSSNTSLIPNPTVSYSSPGATGSLRFTPVANQSGSAVITVTVTDNGSSTAPNVNRFTRTFTINVGSIANKQPTLNPINNPTAINEDAPIQTINLTGITAGEGESQTLKVTATSDNTALIPNPTVQYSSPNTTGSLRYTPAANRSGTANITVKVDDGASANNVITRTFRVTVNEINDAPHINAIANLTVPGNSAARTINLSGIHAGPFERQSLTITATSNNTALIPNPSIGYSSPAATGSLTFTPAANKSGTAVITVRVTDNGPGTAPHVNTFTRNFTVTVSAPAVAANKQPTLNNINNVTINENAPAQTTNLAGITSGGENQTLKVTATSDNTALIPHPTVQYTSPNTTGNIRYTPAANRSGSANITVRVDDGASANNITTRTFKVTVNGVNKAPQINAISNITVPGNSPARTINLSGINAGPNENQTLTITATSNNTALIPNPSIGYSSPAATGSLTFTPVANKSGTAVITVRVTDNGPGTAPHVNTFTRNFTVTVSAPAVAANKQPTLNTINNVTINENAPAQTTNLAGITSGGENQTLKITATSDNTALIPNPTVQYTSPNTTGSIRYTPSANRSGSANITVRVDDGASANNVITRTFRVTVNGINKAPQLNAISNLTVAVNSSARTINLSGINAGPNENQTLTISATSSNTALIPNPSVVYSSPASTGTLTFTPALNKNGTAVITVRVTDNGPGNAPHVNTFTRNFTVTVSGGTTTVSSNPPTINNVSDINEVLENSDTRSVNLSGISAGSGDMASLKITATSNQTGLIPNPVIDYKASSQTGVLRFKPVANKTGTAIITVRLDNGNPNNSITTRTFRINVVPVNKQPTLNALSDLKIKMNADNQTVNLRGITAGPNEKQNLTVSVRSNNTTLIPNPTVNYSTPNTEGSIRFKPAANKTGVAVITVDVKDNGPGNAPHKNSISQSFAVIVEGINSEENNNSDVSEVVTLNLMNAVNNTVILTLKDGMTINTKDLPVRLDQLNIDALVNKTTTGSVVFGFNNNQRYTIENNAAFAIAGNNGPDFFKWDGLTPGNHTISATVFSEKNGQGKTGRTYTVNIKVVDDLQASSFGDILSLHLINAYNDDILFELVEGMTIDFSKLPMALDQLNIRAVSSNTNTGSVIFGFNGNSNYKLENIAPYVIGGNVSNNYYKWSGLKLGNNTVTATTFSQSHGKGEKGKPYTVNFTIVNSKLSGQAKSLSEDQIKFEVLKFWPNPVQDQLSIRFFAPNVSDSNAEIMINNINGQLVHFVNADVKEGENEVIVDTSDMKGGVYIVTIVNNFSKVNLRIIKADN